jgi:elongation factor Ts
MKNVDGRTYAGTTNRGITLMAKDVTAQMVKELRERTGAGMMDCKAALQETGGDMEPAVDLLRKRGLAKAAKKAGRVAAEGLIGVAIEGSKGVVVEVNSETDFVARNDLFQGLVKMIANVVLAVGADVEKIKAAKVGSITIADAIADTIAKIGENMSLRRASSLSVGTGVIGTYTHNSVDEGLGKIGVLVALESPGKTDELKRFGRMVAMHIAASNPQAIDPSGLDPDVVRREREVFADKFKAEGKPANMIDRIVESALKTFYREVCLLDQAFIHEPDKSVAQAVKEAEGKVGGPIKVTGFVRYALGEGIERPDNDFGGEVAALVKSN